MPPMCISLYSEIAYLFLGTKAFFIVPGKAQKAFFFAPWAKAFKAFLYQGFLSSSVPRLSFLYQGFLSCTKAFFLVPRLSFLHQGFLYCTKAFFLAPRLSFLYQGFLSCTKAFFFFSCTKAYFFLTDWIRELFFHRKMFWKKSFFSFIICMRQRIRQFRLRKC